MSLLKKTKARIGAWWKNNGWRKAHAELVRNGGLNYGHWTGNGWVDGNRKVDLFEVMGVIDQHVEAAEMALGDAMKAGKPIEILDAISASVAVEALRDHLLQELTLKKGAPHDQAHQNAG